MKTRTTAALCAVMLTFASAAPVFAATSYIERACKQSGRSQATPTLCSCIQSVANSTLSRKERYVVSKWFINPQKAQQTRQSDRRGDEELWLKYKAFGERARKICG